MRGPVRGIGVSRHPVSAWRHPWRGTASGPSSTTWHAEAYVLRLVEVLALADVVVYVASDERYNDEMPTQFLQLILQAGKPVVTCLTKMKPENAQALVDHYRREVVARIPECTRV